jgi:GNAT superfamily N-acetyltransferase
LKKAFSTNATNRSLKTEYRTVSSALPMLSIRPATIDDAPLLATMIRELAGYERLSHEVRATADDLARDGFGADPKFRSLIAEVDGQPAGYALLFQTYSTFRGSAGLFLEDIFIRPQFRRQGIGKELFAHMTGICVREGYSSLQWEVLDWNQPAIDFYRKLGAVFLDDWKVMSLAGEALQEVARNS